jgi:integrase
MKDENRQKSRRGNREGSIYERSPGLWIAAVTIPGTRKRLTARAKSKSMARMKLDALRQRVHAVHVDQSGLTIKQVYDLWHGSLNVSAETKANYAYAWKHVAADLAGMRMQKLSPLVVEELLQKLRTGRRKRMAQAAANVLKRVCGYAKRLRIVHESPFQSDVPSAPRKAIQPFTVEETQRILDAARSNRLGGVIYLAFLCGMRQGEIFGLQWQDVDFPAGELRIRRQLVESEGKVRLKVPKTKSSLRTLAMGEIVTEILKDRWAAATKEKRSKATDSVFPGARGAWMRRSNFGHRVWQPLLNALEIKPHRGLHHARHTAASLLLSKKVDLPETSATLGHANPGITLKIYSHAMGGVGIRAAAMMDQTFNCFPVASERPESASVAAS